MTASNKGHTVVSFHGSVYILTSLVLLCTGIIRGELVSTLCGATLLAYAVFAFFLSLTLFLCWKNKTFSIEWKSPSVIIASVCPEQKKSLSPFLFISEVIFSLIYATSPEKAEGRIFLLEISITQKDTEFTVPLQNRGMYYPTQPLLLIRDFSRFFTFTVKRKDLEMPDTLVVFPEPDPPQSASSSHSDTGITKGKSTFRRSEDLYESRTYTPGDDPRKINWKVYAHTGELAIRQGELLPPPANEYFIIINNHISAPLTEKKEIWLDILINRASFMVSDLLNQRKTVSFMNVHDNGEIEAETVHLADGDMKRKLLTLFSKPQITSAAFPAQRLLSYIPSTSAILFFSLPQKDDFFELLRPYSQTLNLFLGPGINEDPKEPFLSKIIAIFRIPSTKKIIPDDKELRQNLRSNFITCKKGGFNVSKI